MSQHKLLYRNHYPMMRICTTYTYTFFFFSSRRRHTRFKCDWSSDVCSSDLKKTARILVIDDDPNQALVVRQVLEATTSGYVVETAANAQAGLDLAQKEHFDEIGRASCRERV